MTPNALQITPIERDHDPKEIRALFGEYLGWANALVEQHYRIQFDIDAIIENDMKSLEKYLPPRGRLFLAHRDNAIAGCIGLQTIGERVGEFKRLYVRPQYRRTGVGSVLISAAITCAIQMQLIVLRLDSARFMTDAHSRYRSFGFKEIAPYAESEIPAPFHKWWFFMELVLDV